MEVGMTFSALGRGCDAWVAWAALGVCFGAASCCGLGCGLAAPLAFGLALGAAAAASVRARGSWGGWGSRARRRAVGPPRVRLVIRSYCRSAPGRPEPVDVHASEQRQGAVGDAHVEAGKAKDGKSKHVEQGSYLSIPS